MAKKLSVSVSDELWARALAQRPDLNPSRLVQTALESWTRAADSAGFSVERPPKAEKKFQLAREWLGAIAREQFEAGYLAAVDTMPKLDWLALQDLADRNFDVKTWAEGYGSSEAEAKAGFIPEDWSPDPATVKALYQGLGPWIMPYNEESPRPTIPFLRGFAKAFRELWEETVDGPTRASGAASSTNGEGALGS
jgi:hypothetical protein